MQKYEKQGAFPYFFNLKTLGCFRKSSLQFSIRAINHNADGFERGNHQNSLSYSGSDTTDWLNARKYDNNPSETVGMSNSDNYKEMKASVSGFIVHN
jgi:hypothetical protein